MKISILWSSLADYSVAFFRELATYPNCKIQLIYCEPSPDAPYEDFDLSFSTEALNRSRCDETKILKTVHAFSPDGIFMCGWNFREYMNITKKLRRENAYVVCANDHQWEGTLRQWLGTFSSRWYLKPSIDCFLVSGERQANLTKKLGYENILYGLHPATVDRFVTSIPLCERDPSFIFVGRLSPEKGVENLLQAYCEYRKKCPSPWKLKIAGTGRLKSLFNDTPGVEVHGFVQPDNLPNLMHDARTLILPSLWEPWGVVIHEGAAAGLPIIATYKCGASTVLVRDGINGFVIQPQPRSLAHAMLRMTECGAQRLQNYGDASRTLAQLWTPQKLACYFIEHLESVINAKKPTHVPELDRHKKVS